MLSVDQAVTAILGQLVARAGNDVDLTAVTPVVHAAFERVHDEVPDIFPRTNFGKYGSLKNSEAIDHIWRRLVVSGHITTDNPRLVTHRIKMSLADYYESEVASVVHERDLEDPLARAVEVFDRTVDEIMSRNEARDLIVSR